MSKKLNEMSQEIQDRNFLKENPDIPLDEKVVISTEIPNYETVQFFNLRDPGSSMHFHYATATHPLKNYDLLHGYTYSLPEEVCKWLDGDGYIPNACQQPEYGSRQNAQGLQENYIKSYTPNFRLKRVRN